MRIDERALRAALREPKARATEEMAGDLVEAIQSIAPVRTGAYRAGIHYEPDPRAEEALLVTHDAPYGLFVEVYQGTMVRAIGIVEARRQA